MILFIVGSTVAVLGVIFSFIVLIKTWFHKKNYKPKRENNIITF